MKFKAPIRPGHVNDEYEVIIIILVQYCFTELVQRILNRDRIQDNNLTTGRLMY